MGELSDLITLPIDMKKLRGDCALAVGLGNGLTIGWRFRSPYPKVAPEPSMNWPRVLMIPLGPAPYLAMLTVPGGCDVRQVHLSTGKVF